jgi:hypothetical protein
VIDWWLRSFNTVNTWPWRFRPPERQVSPGHAMSASGYSAEMWRKVGLPQRAHGRSEERRAKAERFCRQRIHRARGSVRLTAYRRSATDRESLRCQQPGVTRWVKKRFGLAVVDLISRVAGRGCGRCGKRGWWRGGRFPNAVGRPLGSWRSFHSMSASIARSLGWCRVDMLEGKVRRAVSTKIRSASPSRDRRSSPAWPRVTPRGA